MTVQGIVFGLAIGTLIGSIGVLIVNSMWHRFVTKVNERWAQFSKDQSERWRDLYLELVRPKESEGDRG